MAQITKITGATMEKGMRRIAAKNDTVVSTTITLHMLDAQGRVQRFLRKHPDLYERVPMKELALYMNLSAETLSRLKQRARFRRCLRARFQVARKTGVELAITFLRRFSS